jgi:hypothetical protein
MDFSVDIQHYGWQVVVVLFLAKEAWLLLSGSAHKHLKALDECTDACRKAAAGLEKLEIHLAYMKQATQKIPKVEQDVNLAWAEIRNIKRLMEFNAEPR